MKEKEVIEGVCPGKASHYIVALDKGSGERHISKDEVIRNYEKSFVEQCTVYKGRMINKPFHFIVDVYYPDYRHDIDGALKTLLDCAQYAKIVTDDRFCVKIDATRHYDPIRPRVEFSIIETEPTLFG